MSYRLWGDYVPVAARRAQAERELARLRKAGQPAFPVKIEGRAIAKTFWGKAWCENLEAYKDYENRLPRGRTYVRNGSVVDLRIASSSVTAMVMGSSLYRVAVTISALPDARWNALCRECAGGIDSVIELLQGRFSDSVMERLCRPGSGLFPRPSEIRLSCTCPDYSDMCKHVAATLYGVGARLDSQPELLFRLRSVDEKALVGRCESSLPFLKTAATKRNALEATDLSALFGLDIAPAPSSAPGEKASSTARPRGGPADKPPPASVRTSKQAGRPKGSQMPGKPIKSSTVDKPAQRARTRNIAVEARATKKPGTKGVTNPRESALTACRDASL